MGMLACSFVGSPDTVQRQELAAFIERTQADELMVAAAIHDHGARLRSYEHPRRAMAPALVRAAALA